MEIDHFPLVSCLCVTSKRSKLLERAINCFYSQTYPNKELIVVSKDNDMDTKEFMTQHQNNKIHHILVQADPSITLGKLRNIAIDNANGMYICQWDDDDWHHCQRISWQVSSTVKNLQQGSILTNLLLFDELNKQAYFSFVYLWEGSILLKKVMLEKHNIHYPSIQKGEDSVFIKSVLSKCRIYPLVSPPIYIYTAHGNNTWDRNHFNNLFKNSQKLSTRNSALIHEILDGKFSNQEASRFLQDLKILEEINFLYNFNRFYK